MNALNKLILPPQYKQIHSGKVRDTYSRNGERIIVVSDRVSAFDAKITDIPYKGQVLNQMSAWWFNMTKDLVRNHVVALIDPNVMIVKNAKMFPVEVVVRGYMTGSTSTSIWVNYNNGARNYCGHVLPEGISKNQKLERPLITPTTKPEVGHDTNISREEIISSGLVPEDKWIKIEEMAMKLYLRGVELAKERGLIFVDTKYEFGEDEDGNIIVCDEVNTPDSSRYWIESSYSDRIRSGKEPESLDKEFLRLKLKELGFSGDGPVPEISDEFKTEVSEKYIALYERVTGEKFVRSDITNIQARIIGNLDRYFS